MDIRKTLAITETVHRNESGQPVPPIVRVALLAVIANPCAGRFEPDLSSLFDLGGAAGERLAGEAVALLGGAPVSYGKAAIVGTAGEFEHGAAMVHPRLGKPLRAAVGGGKALIPSNVKVGPVGTSIDLPLGHKDDGWSFDHFDTMTVTVPDAPRPDEIVLAIAVADGGRALARSGDRPLT